MAAPSVTVRALSKLSRFPRSLLYPRAQTRWCSTKNNAEEATREEDKPSTSQEEEAGPSEIETKLQEENQKLQDTLKSLDDKYKRALAETENVRSRMMKQVEDTKLFGIQGFCKDLLEVSDILDRAADSVPNDELEKSQHLKDLFQGITMTNTQLLKVFSKHGLSKVTPEVGEKFDPNFHEALFEVPLAKGQEGGTVAMLQKNGFKLHNRTLRPALVGVFKSS